MHELGVYFHRCAGNTWELSGEVAEHLEGGAGAEVGVRRCPFSVPHSNIRNLGEVLKLVYEIVRYQ